MDRSEAGKTKTDQHIRPVGANLLEKLQSVLESLKQNPEPSARYPTKFNLNSISESEWTGGDLNPRPLECKSSVHTN
jgi:hypothetical protein